MIRYFIKYEDYINDNLNDTDIKIYNKMKTKKGLYTFEEYNFLDKNNKKLNLMIEIKEEDLNKYIDFIIRKYELIENNLYKKAFYKKEKIKLINFNAMSKMDKNELNKGKVIILEPCKTNNDYLYIKYNTSAYYNKNLLNLRNDLFSKKIGSDIYFYTENNELLERYSEYITEIKEKEHNKYEIEKLKLYIIDSVKNSDLIGFSSSNYYYLNILSNSGIPVFILEDKLSLKEEYYGKQGYIIMDTEIEKILKNSDAYPLLKFINIYEIENGKYRKTSVVKEDNITLKYQRINKKIQ